MIAERTVYIATVGLSQCNKRNRDIYRNGGISMAKGSLSRTGHLYKIKCGLSSN